MKKTNIVFVLIDDMGWKDLVCYGSSFYETPNIDRLAREGMRFSDAYAACPVCSPTRASILTGKYPATVGITDWIDANGQLHPAKGRLVDVPYLKHLPSKEHSLASALNTTFSAQKKVSTTADKKQIKIGRNSLFSIHAVIADPRKSNPGH